MSDAPDPTDLPEPPPLGSALAADAAGAQVSEAAGHGHPRRERCQNCDTPLQGPYCHQCGQHDFDINQSFGHTFLEALENFFHFDTKLFRNVVTLLFRPGRLTAAFNAGKRAAQMPPFRLYVFVSFLFFFLAFLGEDQAGRMVKTTTRQEGQAALLVDGKPVSLSDVFTAAGRDLPADSDEKRAVDEVRAAAEKFQAGQEGKLDADHELGPFRQKLQRLMTPEGQRQILHGFLVAIPKILLLCLPLFALYTRFLFRKSGRLYLQHLVMALHFHTFFYLWFMVRDGWVFLVGFASEWLAGWLQVGCNLWFLIYPVFMLRHLFANSWPRTLVKSAVLTAAYAVTIGIAFLATMALIVFVF
ncbi:MAG: DUF3667 domain-containing protein [Opitutaceae bacterium]|nr:DUF3667 domain-containing protein [Opitutaceae bacterium]